MIMSADNLAGLRCHVGFTQVSLVIDNNSECPMEVYIYGIVIGLNKLNQE